MHLFSCCSRKLFIAPHCGADIIDPQIPRDIDAQARKNSISVVAMADIYQKAGFDFSNHVRHVLTLILSAPVCSLGELSLCNASFGHLSSNVLDFCLTYFSTPWNYLSVCRNEFLQNKGVKAPKATSTGTTIVGCLFKDGIVLGADTRATEGPIVADKNCEKVRAPPFHEYCLK